MNPWLLVPLSGAVLYVGWQIMALVFRLIDAWKHSRASEPRTNGVQPAEGKDA